MRSWVAMAQREVGERLAAAPGGGAYGTPSVLAQLACEVRVLRAIPRTVFYPVPNVDSVLVGLHRRDSPAAGGDGQSASAASHAPTSPALRRLVAGSFAHRRKTLAGSLALVGRRAGALARAGPRGARRARPAAPTCARSACRRSSSARWRGCWRCERARLATRAGAGEGQPRPVPRADAATRDGRHELVTVMQSISLADELRWSARPRAASTTRCSARACRAAGGEPGGPCACAAFARRPAGTAPPLRLSIDKRIPVAAGLGGRLGRRGGDAAPGPTRVGAGRRAAAARAGRAAGRGRAGADRAGALAGDGRGRAAGGAADAVAGARAARAAGGVRAIDGGRLRGGRRAGPGARARRTGAAKRAAARGARAGRAAAGRARAACTTTCKRRRCRCRRRSRRRSRRCRRRARRRRS